MRNLAPHLALLAGLCLLSPAAAEEVYRLKASDGSDFSGTLTLRDPAANGLRDLVLDTPALSTRAAVRVLDFKDFRANLPTAGAVGALQGASNLELAWQYDLNEREGKVTIYKDGALSLAAKVEPQDKDDTKIHVGRLLAFKKEEVSKALGKAKAEAKDALRDAIEDGIDVSETLKLSKYFHVGIETGIRAIPYEEYTPMQASTRLKHPDHVWLANYVEGGARVPLNASIPLGGAASFNTGINANGELRYTVVDLYEKPTGVKDVKGVIEVLKGMGRRVFDLPLTAQEALDLTVGAERALEGRWSLTISGNLTYGHDEKIPGTNVEVGASARVGGFYRLRNTMRVEVSRLPGTSVRVQTQKIRFKGPGVGARLLVGLDTSDEALEPDDTEINEFFVKAADELFKIELRADAGKESGTDFDFAYHLDLSKAPARDAYEAMIRGDMRIADSMLNDPESGVTLEFRVFEQEDWFYKRSRLVLSRLIGGKWNKDVHVSDMNIEDEAGRHLYNVFRYNQQKKKTFLHKSWRKSLLVDVVRSSEITGDETPDQLSVLKSRRALRYRLVRRDASTYNGEMRRIDRVATALGLGDPIGLNHKPKFKLFKSRYGKTELRLDVEISEWGIRTIMGKAGNPDLIRDAFAEAYDVVWEVDPRKLDPHDDDLTPREETALRKLPRFVESVVTIRNSGWTAANHKERAKHFKRLIEDGGWDMVTVVALCKLAPSDCVRVQMSIDGKRMSFDDGFEGERFDSFKPNLHGHLDPLQPGEKGYAEDPAPAGSNK